MKEDERITTGNSVEATSEDGRPPPPQRAPERRLQRQLQLGRQVVKECYCRGNIGNGCDRCRVHGCREGREDAAPELLRVRGLLEEGEALQPRRHAGGARCARCIARKGHGELTSAFLQQLRMT